MVDWLLDEGACGKVGEVGAIVDAVWEADVGVVVLLDWCAVLFSSDGIALSVFATLLS